MSEISRRAGEKIKRWGRKVDAITAAPPVPTNPANVPILLVRAQAAIPQGMSGQVKRLVRSTLENDKGTEVEIGDEFNVYNRFGDIEDQDDFYVRWIDGGLEVIATRRGPADAAPCGVCTTVGAASLVIAVTGDVDAAAEYSFSPLCDGSLYLTFTWSADLTWIGTADAMTLDCGEMSPRTLTATMTVTGIDPGNVTIVLNDGSVDVATYTNLAAWQPCVPVRMQLTDYDTTCPCAPWDPWCCLNPIPAG